MKNKIFLGVKGVKPIAFLFLTLLMILPLSSCYNKENREEILKVYNWGDYIDEDILAEFPKWYEEQTGKKIRVIYQTFDINEVMLTKITMWCAHQNTSSSECFAKTFCYLSTLLSVRRPAVSYIIRYTYL